MCSTRDEISQPYRAFSPRSATGGHSSSYHQELESTSRLYSQQLCLVQVGDHYANYEVFSDTPNQPQECNLSLPDLKIISNLTGHFQSFT